mgnify:CR=1 FL=1
MKRRKQDGLGKAVNRRTNWVERIRVDWIMLRGEG